jgi:hypothetical protein
LISTFHGGIKYLEFKPSVQFKRYLTLKKLIKGFKGVAISEEKIESLIKLTMANNSFSNEELGFLKTQSYNEEKIYLSKAVVSTFNVDSRYIDEYDNIYQSLESKYDRAVSQNDKYNTIKSVLNI